MPIALIRPHSYWPATALAAVAATAVLGAASAPPAAARPTSAPTPAPGAATQGPATPATLQPLRTLADALSRAGSSTAGYSGLRIDAGAGRVVLYATGAAGTRTVTAARHAARSLRWSAVEVHAARYSHAQLTRAAQVVMRTRPDVDRIAVPADGSGLQVTTTAPHAPVPTGLGVAVRMSVAAPEQAKSWARDKWQDSTPFIGGDTITPDGYHYCTSGLPAVSTATGKPVMVTAGHCFTTGTRVYTAGGTPGAFHNRLTGNYVGTVGARSTTWDSELLTGTANIAGESDRTWWKPLTSVAYSYDGDYVCQNGAWSFFAGHPTPCGIKVTDGDLWFKIDGYWARGVEGVDVLHGWGAHAGDSGGTVFALEPGNVRQARGIVSSGGADGTPDQKRVDWIEAPDIFRAFGLRLNPKI